MLSDDGWLQEGAGLDPGALGPPDAMLIGSDWELPVHWCAACTA